MAFKTCWVVSDGRTGMENQALGLAEAVGLPITLKRVMPKRPWRWMPSSAWPFINKMDDALQIIASPSDEMHPPWPDLLIGTGRLAMPYSMAIHRLAEGKTFTVQTQAPRIHSHFFDLVVPPTHDLLSGPNVIPILGSPNRVTAQKLAQEGVRVAPSLAHLPRPLVAVLIGGTSRAFQMPKVHMERICEDLAALIESTGAGLAITTSRRTGEKNTEILKQRLKNLPAFIWDGEGHNPYFGFLGLADYILVTSDSTNMVTEATATGKPVYIIPMPGGSPKFRRFHQDMEEYGAARPFQGQLEKWSYEPLNETRRVALDIRKLLHL